MLAYYESAVQGKGAWGGGSLSGHKDYICCALNVGIGGHDCVFSGHNGQINTLIRVSERYYWN